MYKEKKILINFKWEQRPDAEQVVLRKYPLYLDTDLINYLKQFNNTRKTSYVARFYLTAGPRLCELLIRNQELLSMFPKTDHDLVHRILEEFIKIDMLTEW